MKVKIIGLFALTIGLSVTSCGGAEIQDEIEKLQTELEEELNTNTMEALEISAEMQDFVSSFDGTSSAVEGALKKHGVSDEIMENDMGMFNLKSPEVTAQNGDCYTLSCISGAFKNHYDICWTDGKITSIKELL